MSDDTLEAVARSAVQQHARLVDAEQQLLVLERQRDLGAPVMRDVAKHRLAVKVQRQLVDATMSELAELVGFDRGTHAYPTPPGIANDNDSEDDGDHDDRTRRGDAGSA